MTAGEDLDLQVIEFTVEKRAEEPRDMPAFRGWKYPIDLYSPACGQLLYSTTCLGAST